MNANNVTMKRLQQSGDIYVLWMIIYSCNKIFLSGQPETLVTGYNVNSGNTKLQVDHQVCRYSATDKIKANCFSTDDIYKLRYEL